MNSSENNAHFDGSNTRPLNVHAMAQQPYPSFWSQNPASSRFCVPGAGSRNRSLYFPCSLVPNEYPGFLEPQSSLPTTLNRRPVFPVCYYNPAQFWHRSYGNTMKTEETQTELQQVQDNGISQSSCESRGVPDSPHEDEDPIIHKGEERAVRSEQGHDVRHDEMLKSGLTTEMGKGKQGYVAVPHVLPPPHEVTGRDEPHDTLSSDLYQSTGGAHRLPQQSPLCTSMEAVKDLSVQSRSQKPLSIGERKPDSRRGSHGFPEKLDEEGVGEQNSYPQGAQCDKVDEATQCDVSWWQDAELERPPESSPEGSRKGTGEKSVQCGERDEEEVGKQNSYPQGAQCDKVDATQCDVSWWQDAELELPPKSSPEGCKKGIGEKSVQCEEWDEEEVGEQNSYPQGAQCDKVDEATQCDVSWWQDAELEWPPEQVPLVNEESSPVSTTQGPMKKLRRRKFTTDDQIQSIFLNRKTVYLKKNATLHIVLPDDSDEYELEEEEYEVEWLFEEDSSVSSSKERFYREACRATKVSHGPQRPILVWPSQRMHSDGKYAEYENIPLMSVLMREEGHEIIYSKLRTGPVAVQEGSSQESLECK